MKEISVHVAAMEILLKAKGLITEEELARVTVRVRAEADQMQAELYDRAESHLPREDD